MATLLNTTVSNSLYIDGNLYINRAPGNNLIQFRGNDSYYGKIYLTTDVPAYSSYQSGALMITTGTTNHLLFAYADPKATRTDHTSISGNIPLRIKNNVVYVNHPVSRSSSNYKLDIKGSLRSYSPVTFTKYYGVAYTNTVYHTNLSLSSTLGAIPIIYSSTNSGRNMSYIKSNLLNGTTRFPCLFYYNSKLWTAFYFSNNNLYLHNGFDSDLQVASSTWNGVTTYAKEQTIRSPYPEVSITYDS